MILTIIYFKLEDKYQFISNRKSTEIHEGEMFLVKNNKIIYVIIFLIISASIFIGFFPDKDKLDAMNDNITTEEHLLEQTTSEDHPQETVYIDLYSLYYSSKLKHILNTLTDNDKQMIREEFYNYDLDSFIINTGGLYDLWLFLQTGVLIDFQIESEDKEKLIKYVKDLKTDNGFFLSHINESIDQVSTNYLLSTKMSLDIYELLGFSDPDLSETALWIKGVIDEINRLDMDLISFGGHLDSIIHIINYLKQTQEEVNLYESLENHLLDIEPQLSKIEGGFEKFDIMVKLNQALEKELFFIDKELVEEHLSSIRLKEGGFPMYGSIGQPPNILTTYLAYEIHEYLGINVVIPQNDEKYMG